MEKAKIKVYKTPVEEIPCLFNPGEYKISASTNYAEKKGTHTDSSSKQHIGGYQSTLSLTLYYDITENMGGPSGQEKKKTSVRDYTSRIEALLLVEGDLHRPPQMEFIWGDLSYKGVLTSLNEDFSYFDKTGKPLRVKLDLTVSAAGKEDAQQKSPPESPDRTKRRLVTEGMSLWKLAWEEYGDCNKWVEIAECNHLMNPLDISPGQILRLPPLEDK